MSKQHSSADAAAADKPGKFETLGRKLDERPEVKAAEEALRQATEQLKKAQERYQQVRSEAVEGLHHLRDKNVGEMVEATLDWVRRHPAPGLFAALASGVLLGRIFRR